MWDRLRTVLFFYFIRKFVEVSYKVNETEKGT